MERIAILGAGDLGASLLQYLRDRGDKSIVGFLDDGRSRGEAFQGVPVLGRCADAVELYQSDAFDRVVYAIGYRDFTVRENMFEHLKSRGVRFYGVVHPTAHVHPTARLGEGVHVFPGTILDMEVTVENNVVFNTGCIVAHHSTVRSHCYFGPGVRVAGITDIGKCCFVGIGSTIVEKIQIGEGCVIAAGAVVTDSTEPGSLMAGVPAICKKKTGAAAR